MYVLRYVGIYVCLVLQLSYYYIKYLIVTLKFFGIIIVFVIIILLLLQLYDLSCMYLRTYTDIVYELNFQL